MTSIGDNTPLQPGAGLLIDLRLGCPTARSATSPASCANPTGATLAAMTSHSHTPPVVRREVTPRVRPPLQCFAPEARMFTGRISHEAACEADRVRQLRAAIAMRLERGDTLDTVERELIAPAGLPEEQQNALWVYAWSHPKRPALSQCQPRPSVWTALGTALLTFTGIYNY